MQKIEKRSSSEVAADRLREAIVLGDLDMGVPLSEAELGEQLGVSRTPIREAFRQLSQEGLVSITPFRGASVFTLKPGELNDLVDFRELIECKALEIAMQENHKALVDEVDAIMARMARAVEDHDVRSYLAEDTALHLAIVNAARNQYITKGNALIASKMAAVRTALGRNRDIFEGSWNTHQELCKLFKSGDIPAARKRLSKHILDGKTLFANFNDRLNGLKGARPEHPETA